MVDPDQVFTPVLLDPLQIQLPVFIMLGSNSAFAGVCFYRLRRRLPYVGTGFLSLGVWLWGPYLATYPLCRDHHELSNAGFLVTAVLQLSIPVNLVVLVLEEVRDKAQKIRAAVVEVRSEKEALQAKILTAEEQCRTLYDQVRLSEGVQEAYEELRGNQAYETVITDLGMPGIDGHQVARRIKAASPDTPIVMLTGWGSTMKEDGEKAPELSALVDKPARASELNGLLLQVTAPHQGLGLSSRFSTQGRRASQALPG
jgi:CheY-like chemotaxis protein